MASQSEGRKNKRRRSNAKGLPTDDEVSSSGPPSQRSQVLQPAFQSQSASILSSTATRAAPHASAGSSSARTTLTTSPTTSYPPATQHPPQGTYPMLPPNHFDTQQRATKLPIARLPSQRGASGLSATHSRVAQACEQCRRRKIKCSGERPKCKNCSDLDSECVYVTGRRDHTKQYVCYFTTTSPTFLPHAQFL